jgi:hypothetical protein
MVLVLGVGASVASASNGNADLHSVRQGLTALQLTVAALRTQLDALQAQTGASDATLQKQIDGLQGQIKTLDAKTAAQLATLQGQLGSGLSTLQGQINALDAGTASQLTALQGQFNTALQGLQGQLNTLSQQIADLQAQLVPHAPTTRFVDNGDGTVWDSQTGLLWEKKVAGAGCLHCVSDAYNWTGAAIDWIDRLNGRLISDPNQPSFAGYTDWRLPTLAELRTILAAPSPCSASPCINPVFGPTMLAGYWTASTFLGSPGAAWDVFFTNGFVNANSKTTPMFVRAVRGGKP